MALMDIIKKRYSCRSYVENKPVEQEKLDLIFQAARLAPSAKNLQDWRFVVVTDPDKKKQLAASTNRSEIFQKAAAIIAACSVGDYVMTCGQHCAPIDVSIALEHIALQAAEIGLATCWIGSFNPDVVRNVLQIPEKVAIIELMTLGYPADSTSGTKREPVENIVCFNKWSF